MTLCAGPSSVGAKSLPGPTLPTALEPRVLDDQDRRSPAPPVPDTTQGGARVAPAAVSLSVTCALRQHDRARRLADAGPAGFRPKETLARVAVNTLLSTHF